LLVAELHAGVASPLEEDKEQLSLGADVELQGRISKALLADAEDTVARFAARARALRAVQLAVLVTSPGRQASNGDALVAALSRGAGMPARVVTAEEEGALAFRGATSGLGPIAGDTLVCDVGGGSAQVVVGQNADEIDWYRSLDIGSLRLTNRFGLDGDDVSDETLARARAEVARITVDLAPPPAERALATGGTARALHKLVGRTLGPEQLVEGIRIARDRRAKDVAADFGISRRRADRLLGGTLILEAIQARIGMPFEVAAGGIREGAVLTLLARELAA
jgi:exopolyphosphatase/guanosine-5'-triphosphate,3'-diphosphate pyrophosphatase